MHRELAIAKGRVTMKRARTRRLSKFVAVVAPLLSAVSAAQAPTFSVRVLTNPGGTVSSVLGINNAGEAVGAVGGGSTVCPAGCLAVWIDGSPTPLGLLPGATQGIAYSINNVGQVAGNLVIAGNSQAVIWNNGTPTLLPPPGSQYAQTFALSINDSGQVVGQAAGQLGSSVVPVATVWNGLVPTVLGLVSGCTYGQANAINNNGVMAGKLYCRLEPEGVVWRGTTATLLPELQPSQGPHVTASNGVAQAVNNLGVVVGQGIDADMGREGAVAWAKGVATSLETLFGTSSAVAVNDQGVIVGYSDTSSGASHAVIWTRIGASIEDLNTLISATAAAEITLTGATGINASCAIVANGVINKTREPTAFLLTLIDASNCVNGM
jgi:probable HAF family extracellular repeat protein